VIFVPWTLCTLNAVLWQVLDSTIGLDYPTDTTFEWQSLHSAVFSTTLAFLLVFRLNRVALRWWETRRMWGVIVEQIRILVASAMEYMQHSPELRDQLVAWTLGFAVASKQLLRKDVTINLHELAGILSPDQVERMSSAKHPPLYAAGMARHVICRALRVNHEISSGEATSHSLNRQMLENNVTTLIQNIGGMERVSSTPLPLVYVAHLRTFLMIYLLSIPYLYGSSWHYWTIPNVFVLSFALLGIDGAAADCEIPFMKNRANHLDMEAYCLGAMNNVIQIMIQAKELQQQSVLQSQECSLRQTVTARP